MKILIDGNGMELAALLGVLIYGDESNVEDTDADEDKIDLPTETVQEIVDELKAVEAKQTTQTSAPSATEQRKFSKAEAKEILDKIFHDAPPDFIGSLIKTASDTDTEEIIKAFKAMTLTRIKNLERGDCRNFANEICAVRECVEAILQWKL